MRSSVWSPDAVIIGISSVTACLSRSDSLFRATSLVFSWPITFLTFWLGSVLGLFLPSSTSYLNKLLWVCDCVGGTAVGPCFLDRTQASRRCWRGLVWTSTPTLRVLQPPALFPLNWWQLVWPLETEQNSLKIDKLRLTCTEAVSWFQSGTHRFARIIWSVKQIESNTLQFITQMWKSAAV